MLQFRARSATLWSRRGTGQGLGRDPSENGWAGRPRRGVAAPGRRGLASAVGGKAHRLGRLAEAGVAAGETEQRIGGFGHVGDPQHRGDDQQMVAGRDALDRFAL